MDVQDILPIVARVLLFLIAAGIVVTKLVDGLKASGKLDEAQAGEANQAIAFVVSIAIFVLRQMGLDGGIPVAEAHGQEIALLLVTTYSVAVFAKLMHKIVNWLEAHKPMPPLFS